MNQRITPAAVPVPVVDRMIAPDRHIATQPCAGCPVCEPEAYGAAVIDPLTLSTGPRRSLRVPHMVTVTK